MERSLKRWQQENSGLTKESCRNLLIGLKQQHLDPILTRLRGRDAVQLSFSDIKEGYAAIERDFLSGAKGAADACALMFSDFQTVNYFLSLQMFFSGCLLH